MFVSVCVCVCVCVCEREGEREGTREKVCVCVREREVRERTDPEEPSRRADTTDAISSRTCRNRDDSRYAHTNTRRFTTSHTPACDDSRLRTHQHATIHDTAHTNTRRFTTPHTRGETPRSKRLQWMCKFFFAEM